MTKWLSLAIVAIFVWVISVGHSDDSVVTGGGTYVDQTHGFTIDLPKFPKAEPGTSTTILISTAPPVEGFASNITIIVQEIAHTRAEYMTLSKGQFEQHGLTVDSEKELRVSDKEAVLWEYHGTVQGRTLRWMALAVMANERVYLATCTATESEYPKLKASFARSLSSVKFSMP